MKAFLVFLFAAVPVFAQLFSVGVKAGVPLGDAYPESPDVSQAKRYLVGATAEVHLPFRFSVELDAIYKRTGFATPNEILLIPDETIKYQVKANQWEFPLLGKYELTGGVLRPFVDAGPVLRNLSNLQGVAIFNTLSGGAISSSGPFLLSNRNTAGFAVGGGVTFKLLHLRLSPEIRYTRWANQSLDGSANNQADVMVGFTF